MTEISHSFRSFRSSLYPLSKRGDLSLKGPVLIPKLKVRADHFFSLEYKRAAVLLNCSSRVLNCFHVAQYLNRNQTRGFETGNLSRSIRSFSCSLSLLRSWTETVLIFAMRYNHRASIGLRFLVLTFLAFFTGTFAAAMDRYFPRIQIVITALLVWRLNDMNRQVPTIVQTRVQTKLVTLITNFVLNPILQGLSPPFRLFRQPRRIYLRRCVSEHHHRPLALANLTRRSASEALFLLPRHP